MELHPNQEEEEQDTFLIIHLPRRAKLSEEEEHLVDFSQILINLRQVLRSNSIPWDKRRMNISNINSTQVSSSAKHGSSLCSNNSLTSLAINNLTHHTLHRCHVRHVLSTWACCRCAMASVFVQWVVCDSGDRYVWGSGPCECVLAWSLSH